MDGQGESPVLELANSGEKIIFVRASYVLTKSVFSSDLARLLQTPVLGFLLHLFPASLQPENEKKQKWG